MDESLIWQGNFRPEDVARCAAAGCTTRPAARRGLLHQRARPALGVLRALRDCGLQDARDIAFVTFDELTVDDLFTPSITTVVQPAYDIGCAGRRDSARPHRGKADGRREIDGSFTGDAQDPRVFR